MLQYTPFMHFFVPPGKAEPEALLAFVLPILPTPLASRQAASTDLLNGLWSSGVAAFDLRFVRTPTTPGVTLFLICRLQRFASTDAQTFPGQCTAIAAHIQQVFSEQGYELHPLTDEFALSQALTPFQVGDLAEIRRKEELLVVNEGYTQSEAYATYPWEWSQNGSALFFELLSQQPFPCLISIHLEPTRLNDLEQAYLHRATSATLQNFLCSAGIQGSRVAEIYACFAQRLVQPYLLRISLATVARPDLLNLGQALLARLHADESTPVLQFPRYPYEQQFAWNNFFQLAWQPWGSLRDTTPDSARLRYLVDSKGASMAFQLPAQSAKKIKVLLVFANPRGQASLRTQQEDRLIHEAIRSGRYRDNIEEPKVLHAATIHDLSRALLDDEFHIVHISGHGSRTGLILEDELGNAKRIPPEALADIVGSYSNIRCVILNACYGISSGEHVALKTPFTIAMENALGDEAALSFSRGFYDALAAGKEIDFAYGEGNRRARAAAPDSPFISKLFQTS